MKIAITGNTSGIGLELSKRFADLGWEVSGFSRTSGYDLTDFNTMHQMIEEVVAYNPDIFVNNAYVGQNNAIILYEIFKEWRWYDNKTIINISSVAGDFLVTENPDTYPIWKKCADDLVFQLQNMEHNCKLTNIRPGYVDTPAVINVEKPKLSTEQVVDKIMWAERQSEYIQEIKFVTKINSENEYSD